MPIQFSNSSQETTYRKVYDYLTTSHLFRDTVIDLPDCPNFELYYGSSRIHVDVIAWEVNPWNNPNIALVRSYSYLTQDSRIEPDTLQFLMRESSLIRFGAFQLADDNRIMFAHSILGGDGMDMLELQTCILSVAAIADTYDDILIQEFGGASLNIRHSGSSG
jgi:hypothetical protein